MPCPHFQISIVKRSDGQSAVASAAYQSGSVLYSEHDRAMKAYSEKEGIVHTEILLCAHAPPEFADRSTLWNAAEKAETQWNAQLARKIVLALPNEVPKDQYPQMLRDYCMEHFVSRGMCVDFAIHDKENGNPHAHIMLTLRSIDEDGRFMPKSRKEYVLGKDGERIRLPSGEWKTRKVKMNDWSEQDNAELWRSGWAEVQNRYLEKAHADVRVDLRSFERQGIDKVPTVHMGPAACQMERKGIETDLGNLNREIAAYNNLLRRVRNALRSLQSWIRDLFAEKEQLQKMPTLYEQMWRYLEVRRAERAGWSGRAQLSGTVRDYEKLQSTVTFMQQNGLVTTEDFENMLNLCQAKAGELSQKIKGNDSRIFRLESVRKAYDRFQALRPLHVKYRGIFFKHAKEKFYAEYKQQIDEYNKVTRYLLKNGGKLVNGKLIVDVTGISPEIMVLNHENHDLRLELSEVEYDLNMLRQIRYFIDHGAGEITVMPVFRKTELQKQVDEYEQRQQEQKHQVQRKQKKRSEPSL